MEQEFSLETLLVKYRQFRRIYPQIRLSNSLYSNYAKHDWDSVFAYLAGISTPETEPMIRGKRIHSQLEMIGPDKEIFIGAIGQPIQEAFYELHVTDFHEISGEIIKSYIVSAKLDVLWNPYVADYKTGKTMGAVDDQMRLYAYIINNIQYPIFTGNYGKLTQVQPLNIQKGLALQVDDNLDIIKKQLVFFEQEKVALWEDKLDAMFNEIIQQFRDGYFDNFIKQL